MAEWKRVISGLPDIMARVEDGDITATEGGKEVGSLLRKDPAFNEDAPVTDYDTHDFVAIVWDFEEGVLSWDDFNEEMTNLYDWADKQRVWIDPTTTAQLTS